jgi:hypothetical protein
MIEEFLRRASPEVRQTFLGINTPLKIQEYLDSIPYISEVRDRSPLAVMSDRQCHCLDGAILAALALRQAGLPALIMDLAPEPGADDDHVLALFQVGGCYGALAKSNFSGLRYREPIYRSLRELAMSYFEDFFNSKGEKTLRSITRSLNLASFDRYAWGWSDAGVARISKRLYGLKPIPLITAEQAARLAAVDTRSYTAGMYGTDPAGLYKLE